MARKSRREHLSFELTPLIDVVFLLLIFFMVTSVFKKDELILALDLPTSKQGAKEKAQKKEELKLELSHDKLVLNGEVLTLEELEKKFSSVSKKSPIFLRSDAKVEFQRLVKVLDLLQKYKLQNLSIVTEPEKKN